MRKNGFRDAALTRQGADGGVDIAARRGLAQVKRWEKPIGLPEVQRIYGIAHAAGKEPLLFSQAGFTPRALEWANQHAVACYRFPPVTPINEASRRFQRQPWIRQDLRPG
jgi:hypothetical protein